ncbi:MAG: carboxymuconolactone decarboxylase family protein [Ilumatobacteraceae bacterium]
MTRYQIPLEPRTADTAEPDADERLSATEAAMGTVPNMYARMANSPGVLATYLDGYDRFRRGSGFSPPEQEVVFLTISRHFECEYCMAAHSTIGDTRSKVPAEITDAIRDDRPIDDPRLAAVNAMTRSMLRSQGRPSDADVEEFRAAGFTDRQVLELVLAISVKILSNWSNHLFDTPVDDMFAARAWQAHASTH